MLQEIWKVTILGLEDVLKSQFKPVSIETYICYYYSYFLQETAEFLRDTKKVSNINYGFVFACTEFSICVVATREIFSCKGKRAIER